MNSTLKSPCLIKNHLITIISSLFFIFGHSEKILSQSDEQLIISIGVNIIDDSFTKKWQPLNISEEWNMGSSPSYFSLSTILFHRYIIEGALTINNYDKGKLVDGKITTKKNSYSATDIMIKYKLINPEIDGIPNFDPFIASGVGQTKINNRSLSTLNYGFGFYYWIASSRKYNCSVCPKSAGRFGFLLQTEGKSSSNQKKYGNQIQHVFGLVYRY